MDSDPIGRDLSSTPMDLDPIGRDLSSTPMDSDPIGRDISSGSSSSILTKDLFILPCVGWLSSVSVLGAVTRKVRIAILPVPLGAFVPQGEQ